MNVSPSAQTTGAAHGASAKAGKGGDPLADFMALLGQLGITIEGDGTLTTPSSAPATASGAQDIAAKLLARLGKKAGDTPPDAKGNGSADAMAEEPVADGDAKTDDAATTLADMLAQLDPKATAVAEPAKLDVATLIAAVRALASNGTKPEADAAPVEAGVSKTAPAAPSSIASLLARTAPASREDAAKAAPTPGNVQAAFSRLEALVARKPVEAKGTDKPVDDAQKPANDASAPEAAAPDETAANPRAAGAAKLTELLARLTAATKPGAAQPAAAANAASAVHAARQPVDPQLAAIAQAIQRPLHDDKPVKDAVTQPVADTSLGLVSSPAPAPAAVDAAPAAATDVSPTSTSDALASHHLDLARDNQWLDTLARDIARAAHSDTQLRFQLNPEHLGSLKVELLNGANGTSVKLTADTEAARAILVDAQPRLVAEARAQGLRISEAQVDLSGHGGGQRHMAETPVVIRTPRGAMVAEVQQDTPAASGERYA
jgi:flagellar hook-length control protein FliK